MPYSSISELPSSVKDNLPKHAQEIFLSAFNSAYEKYKDEERAFKIAWGAVKNAGYEKVGDTWKKTGNMQIISNAEVMNAEHDVILQKLNQTLHYKDGDVFYPVQLFRETYNKWEGIPVIFGKDHPDFDLFTQNPELALEQINGSIVGSVTVPNVELEGTPRLVGKLKTDNPVIDNLIKTGVLAHSTGFEGKVDANHQLTSIFPHHVLLFIQDKNNNPKDAGAIILNKDDVEIENASEKPYGDVEYADPGYQEDGVKRYPLDTEKHVRAAWSYINMPKNQKTYTADQLANIKAKIKAAAKKFGIEISNKETKMAEGKEDELTKQLEISNKEKETMKSELTKRDETIKQLEISNKEVKEQLKVFEQKETERKKAESESRWLTIKNRIPKGLTHKPEDEAALKKIYEEQTQEFAVRMTEFMNKPELPGEDGKVIVNSDPNAEGAMKASMTKLGIPRIEFKSGMETIEVI